MQILVVENTPTLQESLSTFFAHKNYTIDQSFNDNCAQEKIEKISFDLYIINVCAPDINGLLLIETIRAKNSITPIIVIISSDEIDTLLKAYALGCNEYIKTPFHIKELDIRIGNLLDNKFNHLKLEENLTYDLQKKELIFNDEIIPLRKKEKLLLYILIININMTVTTNQLEDFVWEGAIKEQYPLRNLMKDLRKKLPFDFIKTEVGLGYKIIHQKKYEESYSI